MSRSIMLMGIWLAIPFGAYFWGEAYFGRGAGIASEVGAFAVMLAFVLWDPWAWRWKLALIDGLLLWCRVMILLAGVKTALWLFGVGRFTRMFSWQSHGPCAARLLSASQEEFIGGCRVTLQGRRRTSERGWRSGVYDRPHIGGLIEQHRK